jgi:hypothetical protein
VQIYALQGEKQSDSGVATRRARFPGDGRRDRSRHGRPASPRAGDGAQRGVGTDP